MAHLSIVPKSENAQIVELYRTIVQEGFSVDGSTPLNFFTVQESSPHVLQTTYAFVKSILLQGALPSSVKEMILLAVSAQNHCRYCEATHAGSLEAMGVSRDTIEACMQGDSDFRNVPPPSREVLRFALKAATTPQQLDASDYRAIRERGFTEGEILEMLVMASLAQFVNCFADSSGIEVDVAPVAR